MMTVFAFHADLQVQTHKYKGMITIDKNKCNVGVQVL